MNVECPRCHEISEVDVILQQGQHVVCPFCGEKYSYVGDDGLRTDDTTKGQVFDSVCPNCGFVEEVSVEYLGEIGSCGKCGLAYRLVRDENRERARTFLPISIICSSLIILLGVFVFKTYGPEIELKVKSILRDKDADNVLYHRMTWRLCNATESWSMWIVNTDGPANASFVAHYSDGRLLNVCSRPDKESQNRDPVKSQQVMEMFKRRYALEATLKAD